MTAVAVLGAGPAGLMAALTAAERGLDVEVFEAGSVVGGMSRSETIAGQRIDMGSHRLHPATPAPVMARIKDLLGSDLQPRERNGRILLQGRWVGFPLRMVDMARSLPPSFTARVGVDTARRVLGAGGEGAAVESFADVLQHRLGPTVVSDFYGPYATKLYGVDPAALTAEAADRRVAVSSPLDVVRKTLRSARSGGRTFFYPRNGYGQICDRLAEAVVAAGGTVHLDAAVVGLDIADHDATPVKVQAGGKVASADLVLSTAPQNVLARAMGAAVPPGVVDAAARLRTRAMVLVYLVVDTDHYTPYDAHYFPGADIGICRLSEPKNYRDNPADPVGQTVLCAELACWVGDDIWMASAQDLGALVCADLERAGLPVVVPAEVQVRQLPSVYPVYEHTTEDARAVMESWVRSLTGPVVSLGRQGLGVPDNIHHVLTMGQDVVAGIDAAGRLDASSWAAALDRFGDHVVED